MFGITDKDTAKNAVMLAQGNVQPLQSMRTIVENLLGSEEQFEACKAIAALIHPADLDFSLGDHSIEERGAETTLVSST